TIVQDLESCLWALGGVYEAWQTMLCRPDLSPKIRAPVREARG
ncbi:MAG: hypothetical protein ACI9VR_004826, partial [Cognaticolwellia sp.]